MNGVPRADAVTMEHQVREDRVGVAAEAEQPMGWNYVPESEFVDNINLAEGLWLPDPRRRHGDVERKVCRG